MRKTPKTLAQALVKTLKIIEADGLSRLISELSDFFFSAKQSRFYKTLKSPLTKADEKKAILNKTFPILKLSDESQAVLWLLAHRNQVTDLPLLISALKEIRRHDYKMIEAEVITVKPLNKVQKSEATKTLEKISGLKVQLTEKINPAILGGLVFKLDDSVLDASLLRKIKEMKKYLNT